ncbi:MAG: hypothetical protein V1926_03400 [Candidatus Peregrinibacteria bacterium]
MRGRKGFYKGKEEKEGKEGKEAGRSAAACGEPFDRLRTGTVEPFPAAVCDKNREGRNVIVVAKRKKRAKKATM